MTRNTRGFEFALMKAPYKGAERTEIQNDSGVNRVYI